MRSCWKSDPHIETQSVNNCTYGLPWKGLPPGFMCSYHSGFDRVKWNQHPVYLEADLRTFIEKYFFIFFTFLGYSLWNESLCPPSTHKRLSVAINEEFGKLDYSKQDKERRRKKWEILCDEVGWSSQWCSEECFGPSPRQTAFSHGHVSGKLPICHAGIFLIVGVLTDTYYTLRSGEIKWTLLPKFDFCSKVFLSELQLLRDKCHLLPRKFRVKILKYFQPSFPEEACFLLCGKVDHLLTRRISILLWKRPSGLHPAAISGEEQGTLPTTRAEVRMGKDNAVSFIGVN